MTAAASRVYDDIDTLFRARGLRQTTGGDWLEDSYDYGVWWRDDAGDVYRLTWLGPVHRERGAGGELYLVRLSGPHVIVAPGVSVEARAAAVAISTGNASGAVELLCVVPPADCDVCADGLSAHRHRPPADAHAETLLDGWEHVCGEAGSVSWLRDRAAEARLLWPDLQP